MFSDAERNLNQDTLEYAWLLEIQLGKLSGKATAPQVSFAFIHSIVFLYFYTMTLSIILTLGKLRKMHELKVQIYKEL